MFRLIVSFPLNSISKCVGKRIVYRKSEKYLIKNDLFEGINRYLFHMIVFGIKWKQPQNETNILYQHWYQVSAQIYWLNSLIITAWNVLIDLPSIWIDVSDISFKEETNYQIVISVYIKNRLNPIQMLTNMQHIRILSEIMFFTDDTDVWPLCAIFIKLM